MADDKIFPTTLSGRDEYYNRVIPYGVTNKVRLTIDAVKMAAQATNLTNWNLLYPQSVDPNLTTKTSRDNRDILDKAIETGLREIYNDIPESLLTTADRNTFNLKARDTTPTPRPAITTVPFANAQGAAGGLVEFTCRTESDSSRASILPDADGVEVVYNIGGTQPVSPSACTKNFFSSKAKFRIGIDLSEAGKKLYGYARWKNNSDPNKSGPWVSISAMVTE